MHLIMALSQCPLVRSKTFPSMKWNLEEVLEIEEHIKSTTSCQHPPLEDLVITSKSGSQISTPLLMSCQYGDLEAVKRIIEIWGVNVSTAAVTCTIWSYTRVEGVTPLFVAAFYHHSKIVKYLIEKGANVNSRTHLTYEEYSGMTPLYAATVSSDGLEDERISSIRFLLEAGADPSPVTDDGVPIWMNCQNKLPIWLRCQIITLLVEWGMDLTQCGPDSGNTVLHSWAEVVVSDHHENMSLGVIQMLIEKGADLQARDSFGFSVILTAAIGYDTLPNLIILDYLLDRADIPRQDKIDALETAGAIILAHDENHDIFPLAFQLWRRAVTLRLMYNEDPLHKVPLKSKSGQLSEWTTLDDIQQVEQDPARREIQSLLVRLRIFAGLSQRALEYHMENVLEYLEEGEDNHRTSTQMLEISLMATDVIFRYDLIERKLRSVAIDVLSELLFIFSNLPNDDPNFNSGNLKAFVELVAKIDQLHLPDANQKIVAGTNHIVNLKNLVSILASRPDLFIDEEMKGNLVHLVRRDVRNSSGYNVLLMSCSNPDVETLSIVRLLLKFKVDANAVNNVGDGPLHLLAVLVEPPDDIARLLLEYGAHLDMVNKEGMTAADLWVKRNKEDGEDVEVLDLPDWLQEDVPSLKCLCSRIIHRHRLPYNDEAILPAVLIPFVSLHCSDSHEIENLQEIEDSQEVEDAELDEPNSKEGERKLSPEMERESFEETEEDLNKSPSDKQGLGPASEKLAANVMKAGGGEKNGLKQTKLTLSASKKVDEPESGPELDEFDMEHEKAAPLREETKSAAAAKAAIQLDSDSDDSMGGGGAGGASDNSKDDFEVSDSDEEFARPKKATKHAISSDDDDGTKASKKTKKAATAPPPPVNNVSSEELFDSFIGASPKTDLPTSKRAASPDTFAIDSDSDVSFGASKPKPETK